MSDKVSVREVCYVIKELLQGLHAFREVEPRHTSIEAEWGFVAIVVSVKVALEEAKPLVFSHRVQTDVQQPASEDGAILLMKNVGQDPEARVGGVRAGGWAGADGGLVVQCEGPVHGGSFHGCIVQKAIVV